jgi:hypothetical protein
MNRKTIPLLCLIAALALNLSGEALLPRTGPVTVLIIEDAALRGQLPKGQQDILAGLAAGKFAGVEQFRILDNELTAAEVAKLPAPFKTAYGPQPRYPHYAVISDGKVATEGDLPPGFEQMAKVIRRFTGK